MKHVDRQLVAFDGVIDHKTMSSVLLLIITVIFPIETQLCWQIFTPIIGERLIQGGDCSP